MQLLIVGGSGKVGSLVLPHLAQHHDLRVFDLRPPRGDVDAEYVEGDIRDFDAVSAAMAGADALLFMAMGPVAPWGTPANARAHFDVAVPGLYLCLRAAREHGIEHAVYTSSMSVYREGGGRRYPDESIEPDAIEFYGFAKRLGEQICANAVDLGGPSVVALRLCHPIADDEFPATDNPVKAVIGTSARDTARAILAGLDYRRHGFEAFAISGDAAEQLVPIGRARDVLGWEPLDRTDSR